MSSKQPDQSKLDVLQRALQREKRSRKAAENLLESKSSELYETNQHLSEAREVLEQKVVERTVALRDARDNAVRLMEERTVFLARISHELRTPLNSILGIVQLMLQEESRDMERRKLETVNASSNVLLTMINEILDFTKIEAGETVVENVATNVSEIVDEAVDMLTHTATAKGVALYTQKRAGFPEQVVTDPSRLTQIVLNLLSNAVKFTSEGSVTINLDVIEEPSSELVLSITDTGVGVHPDRLENIFQPFKQSTEGQMVHSGGTGLGLAIVQRSVQLLDGSIAVESSLGQGSTFTVRLPLGAIPLESSSTPLASTGSKSPLAGGSRMGDAAVKGAVDELALHRQMGLTAPLRILVADDNEMNRSVMEMQLDYLGYRADYVVNGEEVVRAVLAHRYDILFLDISMPLLNGEEACSAIRGMSDISQPTIVAVTASALEGDRERYLAGGMDHYLPKPVDSVALAKLVKEIAASKSADSTLRVAKPAQSLSGTADTSATQEPAVLIDLEEIRSRLGDMLEPMLLKVSPIFIAELPQRISRLRESWLQNNTEETASILHALKGSAASAGASAMSSMCAQLESRIRSAETVSEQEIEELARCASATSAQLNTIVSRFQ